MSAQQRPSTRIWLWVIIAAVVVIAAIALALFAFAPRPTPSETAPATPTANASTPSPTTSLAGSDGSAPSVDDRGWVIEPATTNPAEYARAALAAAGTFDTTSSSRDEWLTYLDSWFTPDPRYTSEADRLSELEAAKLELRQSVVLPEEVWTSLADEQGRVLTVAIGDVSLSPAPDDANQSIATADVELTFTRSDPSGQETSYSESARVSVQVLCGPESVPTPGTAQEPGDCKVVRFFPEPIEG